MKKLLSLITCFLLIFGLFSNRVAALSWTIEYSPSGLTNTDVIATVTGFDETGTVILNNGGSSTYTFTNNNSFDFELSGNTSTGIATATVSWIDKDAPEINNINDGDFFNSNITPIINDPNYSGATLNGLEYTGTEISNEGTYDLYVDDTLGNNKTISFTIDKTVPTSNIEYSTTGITNQDVIVTITGFSEIITNLNNTGYTFTGDGIFVFTYEDLAGNTGETIAEVTRIDKTPPTASTIEYSTTLPTNGDVSTIITGFSEEITGLNQTGYIFTGDGIFTFTYEDLAGNTGETIAEVTRIDKEDPTFSGVTTGGSYGIEQIITFNDNKTGVTATLNGAGYINGTPINGYGTFEFIVTDTAGNNTGATFEVDTTTPVITLNGSNPIYIEVFSGYTELGAKRDDNGSTGTVSNISNNINTSVLGNYETNYNYADDFHTGYATRSVIVQDTTNPIVTLNGPDTVTIERTFSYTENGAIWSDNYDGTGDITTIIGSVNTGIAGTYILTYKKTDSSGNIGTKSRTIEVIDTIAPTASTINYSITGLTNQDVIATITGFSEEIANINKSSHTFTGNGTFIFTFEDPSGNTGNLTATVTRIDKVPVTGYIEYSITGLTNQDVIATITGFNKSGVIVNNTSTFTFTGNGTHLFTYEDPAGNTGESLANVTWIDKTPPTASTINYSITGLTNQDVITTITGFSEEITGWNTLDHTFINNGSFVFTYEDLAGNTGESLANVTWIDKTPITASIIYVKDTLTNEDVIATITGFNKTSITITSDSNHTFTGNGTYLFTYEDLAGNTGESLANVTWIDKTPPTAVVGYDPMGPTWTNGSVFAIATGFSEEITGLNATGYLFVTNGTFVFDYQDLAGNSGSNTATVTRIDITPPTVSQAFISLGNTGNNGSTLYYNGTINIKANVSDAGGSALDGSTCEYTLNNGSTRSPAGYNTTYCEVTNTNPQTDLQIAFRIKDNAGNITTGISNTYIFDNTAPTTTASPDTLLTNIDIPVNLSRVDSGVGLFSTTKYCIDTTNTCTPSIIGTNTTITGAENTYETKHLRYQSIDILGNTENIKSNSYILDKVLPILTGTIISYSNNSRNSGYAKLGDTITMYFSTSRNLITLPVVNIIGGSNSSATVTDLGSNMYSATYITKSTDFEGQIQFLVTMEDLIGNIGTGIINSIIFDQTNPAGINITTPTTGQYANVFPFSYNILRTTGSEINFGSDAIKIEYSIDNFASSIVITGGTENIGSLAYAFDNTFNNMNAKIKITATDIPGNTTTIIGGEFTLDGTPPTDINITAPGLYLKGNKAYTINRNGGTDDHPNNITVSYSTGGSFVNISTCIKTSNEQSCTRTTPNITNTGVTLKVTATDKVGLQKTATTTTFMIDNIAPSLSLATTPTWRSTPITGSATASDTHAGINTTGILYNNTAYTTTCNTGSATPYYFSEDGIRTGYACVEDNAGNIRVTSRVYRIDSTPPNIEMETGTLYKNSTFNITATGNDTTAGITNYQRSKLSGTGNITFGSATSNQTTISADTNGEYIIQLKATDAANNSGFATFTLIWDDQAPILSSGSVSVTNQTATFSFYSDKIGTITYSGSCGTGNTNNTTDSGTTITSWTLENNTYNDCSLNVTDSFGNYSTINISGFTINYTTTQSESGGGGGGAGAIMYYTATCNLDDVICVDGKYVKNSIANCIGGYLGDTCNEKEIQANINNEDTLFSILQDQNIPELQRAFIYSNNLGITTTNTYNIADMTTPITRAYLAKMMSTFAMKILNKTPDTTKNCDFNDINGFNEEDIKYIKLSCQLGIMGIDANKSPLKNFFPDKTVTRAIFGTTLSRAIRGDIYNSDSADRYQKHLENLKKRGIMNQITKPQNRELRGYVMLMLMRSNLELIDLTNTTKTTTTTNEEDITTDNTNNNSEKNTENTIENITPNTNITLSNSEQNFVDTLDKNWQFIAGFKRDISDINIKYLQYFLKSKGFYQGTINGTNTEATITALFEWQKTYNIVNNTSDTGAGYLGPKTREILNPLLKEFLNQ